MTTVPRPEVEPVRYTLGTSRIGSLLVAMSGCGVCAVLLADRPAAAVDELRRYYPAAVPDADGELDRVRAVVERLVDGDEAVDLPLDLHGSEFERRVWAAIAKIPAGSVVSYGELARRVGSPGSARAVARACAANRLAVAIPCHRVVRADGAVSGYRWGVERKRALLEREARA